MSTIEPCLCGDPECRRCFPVADGAYAAAMGEQPEPCDVCGWSGTHGEGCRAVTACTICDRDAPALDDEICADCYEAHANDLDLAGDLAGALGCRQRAARIRSNHGRSEVPALSASAESQ